jgi:hypothetical protein
VPGFPGAIRVLALTHSRRNVVQRLPWLISLTHDLPSSFALSGLPVYVAASRLAPFSLGRKFAHRTFMNNADQIKLLLSMFAIQLPTLLVCFVAGVVILGRWKQGSKGSMWALLGFGLAAVLCFAVPVAQTAVQQWVRHSGRTTVESASVMATISIVWSVLRAVTYALLLIAVFAGRSTSPPVSRSL